MVLGDLDEDHDVAGLKRQFRELGRIETYRGRPGRVSEDEAVDEDLLPSEDLESKSKRRGRTDPGQVSSALDGAADHARRGLRHQPRRAG